MPKVSVLIPTYNCAKYIGQAIQSVLDQTFEDFEIVISDNASTDNTEEVVKNFENSRIRYYKNQENIGYTRNVYRLIHELARGEYCIILCADDYFADKHIFCKQVNILAKNPEITFVHTGFIVKNEINYLEFPVIAKDYYTIMEGYGFIEKLLCNYSCTIALSSSMFRLEYARLIQPAYELQLCTDLWLWINLALKGKVAYVPEPLLVYRRTKNSLTFQLIRSDKLDYDIFLKQVFELDRRLVLLKQRAFKKYAKRYLDMLPAIKASGCTNSYIFNTLRDISHYSLSWIYSPMLLLRIVISLLPYKIVNGLRLFYTTIKRLIIRRRYTEYA